MDSSALSILAEVGNGDSAPMWPRLVLLIVVGAVFAAVIAAARNRRGG